MPASSTDVVRYLNNLELEGKRLSTIRLARSALVHAHRLRGIADHENPGRDGVVSETLKGMSTRSTPQRQAEALLPESLNAIRSTAMLPRERSNGGRPESRERAMAGEGSISRCASSSGTLGSGGRKRPQLPGRISSLGLMAREGCEY